MTDQPEATAATTPTVENVGILLVHGMGEQKPLDHLRSSAKEIASFIAEAPGLIRLSIIENLDSKDDAAPKTIIADATFARDGRQERVRLHLHEAWWADLGIRGGLLEQVKFWLWGLGQWAAQVVRQGNPKRNTMKLMTMPRFGERQATPNEEPGWVRQLPSRLMLAAAGLLAILTFFTWSAAKQIVAFLSQRLPEPSLIFLFLGDVKIYEQDGYPGAGSLIDPDLPMRTTIRRRIVAGMTELAAGGYDRWYLFAHSLGTVPAFNAVQETELNLPNYLTEAQWQALPATLKTEAPFVPEDFKDDPPTTGNMMPRRPPWLKDSDGIDRRKLFDRFAGFVTYGSPLDKFAALWPRVVNLNRQAAVFPPGCEWVNMHDPTDPVSARLDAFRVPLNRADETVTDRIPLEPQNFASRASLVFGLSHIRYFRPRPKAESSMPQAIVRALVSGQRTSLAAAADKAKMSAAKAWARTLAALAQLALVTVALTVAAALLLLAIGTMLPDRAVAPVKCAIGWACPRLLAMLEAGGCAALIGGMAVVWVLAALAVLLSGAARLPLDARKRRDHRKRLREGL